MTTKSKVQSITSLASSLATKELEGEESSETSTDLLEALNSVAKLLEAKSGSNNDIKLLAQQVQELVKTKATK